MTSVKLHSHVGRDGLLKLEVPVGLTETDLEVVVIFQPLEFASTPDDLNWPPGFFEQTFGSLQDAPMVREPQGDYEVREEIK